MPKRRSESIISAGALGRRASSPERMEAIATTPVSTLEPLLEYKAVSKAGWQPNTAQMLSQRKR